jgi:hypothetical protein
LNCARASSGCLQLYEHGCIGSGTGPRADDKCRMETNRLHLLGWTKGDEPSALAFGRMKPSTDIVLGIPLSRLSHRLIRNLGLFWLLLLCWSVLVSYSWSVVLGQRGHVLQSQHRFLLLADWVILVATFLSSFTLLYLCSHLASRTITRRDCQVLYVGLFLVSIIGPFLGNGHSLDYQYGGIHYFGHFGHRAEHHVLLVRPPSPVGIVARIASGAKPTISTCLFFVFTTLAPSPLLSATNPRLFAARDPSVERMSTTDRTLVSLLGKASSGDVKCLMETNRLRFL